MLSDSEGEGFEVVIGVANRLLMTANSSIRRL